MDREPELDSFDKFMTAKRIDGREVESFSSKELSRIEKVLEKPIPERVKQEHLLDLHIGKRED